MKLLRSTLVFSSMTLLSRVAGYVRDLVQASVFGASIAMDSFLIAYRIPNFLRRIFAEGAFSQAFVPVFTQVRQSGDERALREVRCLKRLPHAADDAGFEHRLNALDDDRSFESRSMGDLRHWIAYESFDLIFGDFEDRAVDLVFRRRGHRHFQNCRHAITSAVLAISSSVR
jgi:hypothetical protein